jgi:hypothetical protein
MLQIDFSLSLLDINCILDSMRNKNSTTFVQLLYICINYIHFRNIKVQKALIYIYMCMGYSHKGIYAMHTPSIIDGCTVIKKWEFKFSLLSLSLFPFQIRDTIHYVRFFLFLVLFGSFITNEHRLSFEWAFPRVWTFNQHSFVSLCEKLKVNPFVEFSAINWK